MAVALTVGAPATASAAKKSVGESVCGVAADIVDETRGFIRRVVKAEAPKGRDEMAKGCSFVWGRVAEGFSKRDHEGLEAATEDAMDDDKGGRREYAAKDAKKTVVLETVDSKSQTREVEFVLLRNVAAPSGGVRVLGKPLKTSAGLNLRSSPDLKQKENIIGTFAKGEVVAVMASTADGWALIGAQGMNPKDPDQYVGVGYASMRYLIDPDAKAAPLRKARTARPKLAGTQLAGAKGAPATGEVQTARVKASTQCKTVSASTGKARESKTGCATPAGRYEVV